MQKFNWIAFNHVQAISKNIHSMLFYDWMNEPISTNECTESLFICKCSCNTLHNISKFMHQLIQNYQFFYVFVSCNSFEWPEHSLPQMDEWPILNSVVHFFTVEHDGEGSPKVKSNLFLFSLALNLLMMYFVTTQHLILSIFLRQTRIVYFIWT